VFQRGGIRGSYPLHRPCSTRLPSKKRERWSLAPVPLVSVAELFDDPIGCSSRMVMPVEGSQRFVESC
jgi:hypothetical protein